jgi:hypothetical protein
LSFPNGTKEIYLQLDSGERFARRESTGEDHTHGGVSDVAPDTSVERPHGIGMAALRRQRDEDASIRNFFCFKIR